MSLSPRAQEMTHAMMFDHNELVCNCRNTLQSPKRNKPVKSPKSNSEGFATYTNVMVLACDETYEIMASWKSSLRRKINFLKNRLLSYINSFNPFTVFIPLQSQPTSAEQTHTQAQELQNSKYH